tara:strand:- start:17428 stop:18477 length:1050 start_codon:yes stop_codon:yes gene_type:complete
MSLIVTVSPITLNNKERLSEDRNYARKAVHHGLLHKENFENGNSPFHGDLMYHQMFKLNTEKEREIYHNVSRSWMHDAKEAHVYLDRGITNDMIKHIIDLQNYNIDIKYKTLSKNTVIQNKVSKIKDVTDAIALEEELKLLKPNNSFDIIDHSHYNPDYLFEARVENFRSYDLNHEINHHKDYKRIILESPFAGNEFQQRFENVQYAKALIHKLAHDGYAPSASHLLYTQMLDDNQKSHRDLGINRGLDYAHNKDSIIGIDKGISGGMEYGIKRAIDEGRSYNFFTLSDNPEIQQEVSIIRDLDDAKEFLAQKKSQQTNQKLYERTGFIIETPITPIPPSLKKTKKIKI